MRGRLAESHAETENAREESLRTKMASRANSERGKLYQGGGGASGYRAGDDYALYPESGYGSRRGCVRCNFVVCVSPRTLSVLTELSRLASCSPPGGKQRMHGVTRKSRS